MIKIERAAIDLYGGPEKLDADIFTFTKALKDHAKTIGQPAPTAHPFVEQIVRESGGKYEVIEPVSIDPIDPVRLFEDLQDEAFFNLQKQRNRAMVSGVQLNGITFKSDAVALTSLLATKFEIDDQSDKSTWSTHWRVGPGNYVRIVASDVDFLIGAIRKKHAKAFARERELSDLIMSANTSKALTNIDLTKGWEL